MALLSNSGTTPRDDVSFSWSKTSRSLPEEMASELDAATEGATLQPQQHPVAPDEFVRGENILHPTFGQGKVLSTCIVQDVLMVEVQFEGESHSKLLNATIAKLEKG